MPHHLPNPHPCAIRVGSHRFPFLTQFIPIAAAPSAGEGGRPAMVAGGSLANVSRSGADVSLSHEDAE